MTDRMVLAYPGSAQPSQAGCECGGGVGVALDVTWPVERSGGGRGVSAEGEPEGDDQALEAEPESGGSPWPQEWGVGHHEAPHQFRAPFGQSESHHSSPGVTDDHGCTEVEFVERGGHLEHVVVDRLVGGQGHVLAMARHVHGHEVMARQGGGDAVPQRVVHEDPVQQHDRGPVTFCADGVQHESLLSHRRTRMHNDVM
jgi:hypothetical protein